MAHVFQYRSSGVCDLSTRFFSLGGVYIFLPVEYTALGIDFAQSMPVILHRVGVVFLGHRSETSPPQDKGQFLKIQVSSHFPYPLGLMPFLNSMANKKRRFDGHSRPTKRRFRFVCCFADTV